MHFDVPGDPKVHRLAFHEKIRSTDFWKDFGERSSLYACLFLGPEALVSMASAEYIFASHDRIQMVEEEKIEGWTLEHSFFAQMGGFTVNGETVYSGCGILEQGVKLDKRTCEKLGYEINDKSKADLLAKLLAITQISRFLLETISRVVHSYPISPLEYFTCAQVICTLIAYYFWFYKPRNVFEPIELEGRVNISLQATKTKFSDLSYLGKRFSQVWQENRISESCREVLDGDCSRYRSSCSRS